MGKVSKVEPLGGDSPGVKVTMKIKDEALPIHKDAQVEIRERIFLEGNLFMNIKPGSPSAPELDDGDTIPVSQTSAPVQLDQVLGTLQANTRKDLQDLLVGYGEALNGQPTAGRGRRPGSRRQGRDRRHGAQPVAPLRARGPAQLGDRQRGHARHRAARPVEADLRHRRRSRARCRAARAASRTCSRNWNITTGALAAQETDLAATVRELPKVLEAARPALDNLNASFPATRAWALEMIPGVRETPATIKAGFPWVRQTRALLRPSELQGLVDDLQPAVDDFAKFVNGQIELLPVFDLFNRCQSQVVLPSGNQVIQDGALSTGLKNYQEFLQAVQGLVGAGQNFTGNGIYTRFQPGGGAFPVQTGAVGHGTQQPRRASGTRSPRRSARAPRAVPSRPTSRRPPATSRARPT